jgi:hypothetical protein
MVRAEVGQTTNAGVATQGDTGIGQMLQSKQYLLSTIRDWPFMDHRWDVVLIPGSRYVNFPTADNRGTAASINTERPFQVTVLFQQLFIDVDYGIGPEQFNIRNSDLNEAEDPIQRWDFATNIGETVNSDQFEVWPIPVTQQTLRFDAQRQPHTLVNGTDKAEFDDMLMVYMVAAELLMRYESPEAQAKQVLANQRLNYLTSAYPNMTRKVVLGANKLVSPGMKRNIPMVIVR